MNFFPSADNFGIGSYNPVLSGLPSLTSILGKSNPNIKQVQEQTLQERLQLLQNRLEQQYGPEQGRLKMQAAIKQVFQSGMFNASGLSLDQASPFTTHLSNVAPTNPASGLPALSPNLTGLPDATRPQADQPLVASKPAEAATQLTQLLGGMQDLSQVPALTKLSLGQTNFQVINRNGNVVILDPKSKNAFAVTNESGSLSFKQLFLNGEATPNAQPMDRARFMAWLMTFAFPNEDPNSLLALLPSAATAATPASAAATPVATPPAATTAKDNTATSKNSKNNGSDKSAQDNTSSNNAASATPATNPPTDKAATETKTADAKPSCNTPPKTNSGISATTPAKTTSPASAPAKASVPPAAAPPKKPTVTAPATQQGEVAVKLGKNIAV
jgi:hypothetical protein